MGQSYKQLCLYIKSRKQYFTALEEDFSTQCAAGRSPPDTVEYSCGLRLSFILSSDTRATLLATDTSSPNCTCTHKKKTDILKMFERVHLTGLAQCCEAKCTNLLKPNMA